MASKVNERRIGTRRAYEPPGDDDGYRVLVDRVWPRGVSKQELHHDAWLKDVGPSTELRKWFDHRDERYGEFEERYRAELADSDAWRQLVGIAREHPVVTLVFGARNTEHNQATVLRDLLAEELG